MKNLKIPPQAIMSEKIILASILVCPGLIDEAIETVSHDIFYVPKHQIVMRAIEGLYSRSSHIDIVSVSEEIKRLNNGITGDLIVLLSELMEETSTSTGISTHIQLVSDKFDLRRIIKINQESLEKCYDNSAESEVVLSETEGELLKIYEMNEKVKAAHVSATIAPVLEGIELAVKSSGVPRIATGFRGLDEATGGFHNGEMVVIGGRPGMGKSALALDLIINAKKQAAFFSVEMPRTQLTQRLISRFSRVPLFKIRNGILTKEEMLRIQQSTNEVANLPLFIDDSYFLTIPILRSKLRRLQRQYGIEIAAIDYLQIMRGTSKNQSGNEKGTEISNGIMGIAKELNIPILILSQLSRDLEKRPVNSRRPIMSDLRDSGAIEQDAHVILFPYRHFVYSGNSDDEDFAELIIAKQRNGPTGIHIDVKFDGATTHFYEGERLYDKF